MKQISWILAITGLVLLAVGCGQGSGSGGTAPEAPAAADDPVADDPVVGDPAAEPAPPEADAVELEYWRSVKDSEHTDDLWAYLERYPQGTFADLAKSRIERLAAGPAASPPAPPSAGTPSAGTPQTVAPAKNRKQVVQDAIRRRMAGFLEPRVHVAPDIPRRELDNAAQVHGFDASKVLMLYDDGLSGGGKTGFCLTDRKVYWRFVSGSPAYYLDYEDVEQVRVRKKKFLINGYDVGVTMASDPPRAAETFAELLEEIRDELRRR